MVGALQEKSAENLDGQTYGPPTFPLPLVIAIDFMISNIIPQICIEVTKIGVNEPKLKL